MYRTLTIFLCLSVVLLKTAHVIAAEVEVAPRITDRKIIERLTQLEYGQKNLEKQLEGLRSEMNTRFESVDTKFDAVDKRFDAVDKRFESVDKRFDAVDKRFDDLRSEMNAKFASVDKRFDILQWMFGLFITISIVILGFVLRMLWLMQKKQTIMESTLEKQKEELAFIRTLIEKLFPPKGVL
ncbi:MAG: hypothetical protein K8F34_03140 [Candidatus Kuenenia stuttgartiensis]|uniref:Uncharacterized protein n=1 Tax=Kuenenia stuttgartiensis TaxID=174633 RepID=A0A2C9CKK2_KUEST|nr:MULTISPECIES: hypothetical protein [Kuenenia]MBZ0190673.1 hypothetical protein [Candidatus Kuenenia stuttgartiensis]MCF6152557.1 hypothetical protein [Candidatus Kuenenia stuttgartiensis]MCL4727432.1 hypothetical protein [Candidatus Kuenenia stuttgartiensis]MCZ7621982.1 hypothetical protein [Candidatus Kuenenia sp.]SOH06118.1 hypothetical protein KSMBR1_3645 [Candidatus Kuenenia stuttgartiensis]